MNLLKRSILINNNNNNNNNNICLGLLRDLFPVGLPVKMLKVLPSSILATCPAHLNLLELIAPL